MELLFTLLLSAPPANAGKFLEFCERWLIVAEDPWPFAEHSSDELLFLFEISRLTDTTRIKKELEYRRSAWMLNQIQVERFEQIIRSKENEG